MPPIRQKIWTIYKYPLETVDEQTILMPSGAKVLTVQLQGDVPCVWALVNVNSPLQPYRFDIVGTGNPFPGDIYPKDYVGTFQMNISPLVFHVFQHMKG